MSESAPYAITYYVYCIYSFVYMLSSKFFRLGSAMAPVDTAFYVALVGLFYDLFKPVNRRLSIVAFFGLVGCAIQAGGSVFQLFSLVLLGTGKGAHLLNPELLPTAALLLAKLNDQAVLVAPVFFGNVLPADRLSHIAVDLPPVVSRGVDDIGRLRWADIF